MIISHYCLKSWKTGELGGILFYEEFMSDMIEKHCYNGGYSNIFLKYVQNSIDNCPFTKYTYSTLKHIC